jgi:hypothetical protein
LPNWTQHPAAAMRLARLSLFFVTGHITEEVRGHKIRLTAEGDDSEQSPNCNLAWLQILLTNAANRPVSGLAE